MSRAGFEPTRVLVVDLDQPVPAISPQGPDGRRHGRALVLARSGGRPVALTELEIDPGLTGPEVAQALGSVAHDVDGERPESLREVSVVVATRDRPAELTRCLESLGDQRHRPHQVVVVDNAPADRRAQAVVESFASRGEPIAYVLEPRPGLATAHNAALPDVTGEVVAFTDDDVVADRDWLGAIGAAFDVVDDVGCVTGMILPAELETPSQAWIEAGFSFNKGLERRVFDLTEHRPDDRLFPYTAGSFGSGANMAFRADVLDEIGGFDESLG
ncbi:MAG: glycosyltransferase family A protein, partial [Actinomycetota bacterium]